MNITDKLADALRELNDARYVLIDALKQSNYADKTAWFHDAFDNARKALAAHDAQQAQPADLTLQTLKRDAIKSPFAAGAREERVQHAGRVYHVARGHESKGGWYYTVRGPSWQGYRIASSIEGVKAVIRGDA